MIVRSRMNVSDEDCRFPSKHERGVFTRIKHLSPSPPSSRVSTQMGGYWLHKTEDSNLVHLSCGTSSVCEGLIVQVSSYLRKWQCLFDKVVNHIQTCQCQSATLRTHEWMVYKLSLLLSSVVHRVKDRIPPRTLVMDVTMTHDHYGRTTQRRTNGVLSHRVSSTGAPQSDGVLNKTARIKIRHYRQIYADRPDPIVLLPVAHTSWS
jgi:hypothetical protein